MTTPIPDQLQQWHAQFCAGNVPFARILDEIDAAIASYSSTPTPDEVVHLAQHWILRHALYDCFWHKIALPECRLITALEDWHTAYALACQAKNTRSQLDALLAIYRVNPHSRAVVLPACYALMDDMPLPSGQRDTHFLIRRVKDRAEQYLFLDLMITTFIAQGHYETALQMAGSLSKQQLDQQAVQLVRCHLVQGDLQQAWRCCFLITHPDNFAHMRTEIHCAHILMLVHAGHTTEAEARLDRALAEIDKLPRQRLRTTLAALLVPCCAALHRWQKAAHLHHVATRRKDESISETWQQWNDLLASEADPQRLMAFYHQLTQQVYSYGVRLAVLEKLVALGYTAFARQKLRLHLQMPSLAELVLPLLDALGDHELVNSHLQRLINEANQRQHDVNPHLMRVAQHFVRLRRYDQLEPLLAVRPVSANDLFNIIEAWVTQAAAAQNWAEVTRLVNEWTQPEKVYRPAFWHWITCQFRLLCRAAIHLHPVDPAQAQAWLQTAEALLQDGSLALDRMHEQHDLLIEAYLATNNAQGLYTNAEKLMDFTRLNAEKLRMALSAEASVEKIYQLAERCLPHQPHHARLLLRLARQQRPHLLRQMVAEPLSNLSNRKLLLASGTPVANDIAQVVTDWRSDHLILRTFANHMLLWRQGASSTTADLPERVIQACIALLTYLAQATASEE